MRPTLFEPVPAERTVRRDVFTLALPITLLLLFAMFFGNHEVAEGYRFSQLFAPMMAAFATVSATFTRLSISTAADRERGILKRVRGTPLPPWAHMAGRIGSSVWISMVSMVLMFTISWALYGFVIRWEGLVVALPIFVLGVATFSALGLAMCAVVRSAAAMPAVAHAMFLPMASVSGAAISMDTAPRWLTVLGGTLPLTHFAEAFRAAFDPRQVGRIIGWEGLAIMSAWFIVGFVLATRYFSWDP